MVSLVSLQRALHGGVETTLQFHASIDAFHTKARGDNYRCQRYELRYRSFVSLAVTRSDCATVALNLCVSLHKATKRDKLPDMEGLGLEIRLQISGTATVNPHQFQFCRSLLGKASIIENTKIRGCLHVYSDSNDGNIKNIKYRNCSQDYKVTCNLC